MKLRDFGNTNTWRPLNRPELGPMNSISDVLRRMECENQELFGSVRLGPNVIVVSDASGHHARAGYEAYSFLIVDFAFCWLWDEMRREVRSTLLHDGRRMSFKCLNDRRRKLALVPFLRAANSMPGTLLTVLVAKNVGDLVEEVTAGDVLGTQFAHIVQWKQPTRERLMRVAHFGSLLIAGLCRASQNVYWFNDEDDIVANDSRVCLATEVVGHILSHYLSFNLGHIRFGTTRCDDGSLSIEDLAAIPDLVAGSLSELLTATRLGPQGVVIPLPPGLSPKTRTILGWLADGAVHPLKRVTIVLDRPPSGMLRIRGLTATGRGPAAEFSWRPELQRRTKLYLVDQGARQPRG